MNDTQQPGADELAAAMRQAADGLEPPTPQLVTGGIARGRRMRAARRAQMVVASLAVVAAGVGGAIVVPGLGDDGKSARVSAGTGPINNPATTTPPLTDTQRTQPVVDKLTSLLPAGAQIAGTPDARIQAQPGLDGALRISHGVTAVVQDARGRGDVTLLVDHRAPTEDITCPAPAAIPGTTCENTTLPDGGRLRVEKNREYPASDTTADGKAGPNGRGARVWSAHLVTPTGLSLHLSATDSVGEKSGQTTRPEPVLTPEQLRAVVTDPGWAAVIAQAEAGMAANTPGWGGTGPKEGAGVPSASPGGRAPGGNG